MIDSVTIDTISKKYTQWEISSFVQKQDFHAGKQSNVLPIDLVVRYCFIAKKNTTRFVLPSNFMPCDLHNELFPFSSRIMVARLKA